MKPNSRYFGLGVVPIKVFCVRPKHLIIWVHGPLDLGTSNNHLIESRVQGLRVPGLGL